MQLEAVLDVDHSRLGGNLAFLLTVNTVSKVPRWSTGVIKTATMFNSCRTHHAQSITASFF